jgi:3'-5' exoribonuclease
VDLLTITQLKQAAPSGRVEARIRGQVDSLTEKATRDGKPFWELVLADAEGKLTLRAWSDSPAFAQCAGMSPRCFIEVSGEFSQSGAYGLDSKRWTSRDLSDEERDTLLAGRPELRAKQSADFAFLTEATARVADPRLPALVQLFFADFGPRFQRAAAARGNHHARRGGLVEHVAQMLRAALALADLYPVLNRDLLTAAVIFHDCGKLWENSRPADGFVMPFDERGELLGHITIGIELVNALWRKLFTAPEAGEWTTLIPSNEDVRLHLLHLIAAHHGELQFGSPVPPKTPEAWALHYVDNLDAKLEMMSAAYQTSRHLADRIQKRVWPLPGNLVAPLAHFPPGPTDQPEGPDPNGTKIRFSGQSDFRSFSAGFCGEGCRLNDAALSGVDSFSGASS